jgi:hypothetical protein
MSDLRELTNAELDIVGGGRLITPRPQPEPGQGSGGGLKLVEEIIVDILEILEPNDRLKAPQPA